MRSLSLKEIKKSIDQRLSASLGVPRPFLSRSILNATTTAFSGMVHLLMKRGEFLEKQLSLKTCSGKFLDRHGETFGLTRRKLTEVVDGIQETQVESDTQFRDRIRKLLQTPVAGTKQHYINIAQAALPGCKAFPMFVPSSSEGIPCPFSGASGGVVLFVVSPNKASPSLSDEERMRLEQELKTSAPLGVEIEARGFEEVEFPIRIGNSPKNENGELKEDEQNRILGLLSHEIFRCFDPFGKNDHSVFGLQKQTTSISFVALKACLRSSTQANPFLITNRDFLCNYLSYPLVTKESIQWE